MDESRRIFFSGLRVTGFWTFVSRILGMVRDMATAALFGLSAGGLMDAFVLAFRIPNLFRRLFGEGALTASYLPIVTERLQQDRTSAWQLATVVLTWLAVVLTTLVLLGEAICGLLWMYSEPGSRLGLVTGLTAIMLPYMVLICLAAIVSATLHALNHFAAPALVPVMLNLVWILGACLIAPRWTADGQAQAYVLAVCILCGGILQLLVQLPVLRRLGFRLEYNWSASRAAARQVAAAMLPMLVGLTITQINTLMDSVIAWVFSAPREQETIQWLGSVQYPMQQGAAASVYYGERLYQFPLGLLGIAVATVIFPLLSRHAARGERQKLAADLTIGLRIVLFLSVPAAVGLIMLAEPVARLLFERGQFTAADTARTAGMIRYYAIGVWAYCALPVLIRGFYALGNKTTPAKIGMVIVGINLVLNLSLIWVLSEKGLALATAVAAVMQVVLLSIAFARGASPLIWRDIGVTTVRAVTATAVMVGFGLWIMSLLPRQDGLTNRVVGVLVPLGVCVIVYLGTYVLLKGRELNLLLGRGRN